MIRFADHPRPRRRRRLAAVVADRLAAVRATVVTAARVAVLLVAGAVKVLWLWLRSRRSSGGG